MTSASRVVEPETSSKIPLELVPLEMVSDIVLEPVNLTVPSLVIPEPLLEPIFTLLRSNSPEEMSATKAELFILRLLSTTLASGSEITNPLWELKSITEEATPLRENVPEAVEPKLSVTV